MQRIRLFLDHKRRTVVIGLVALLLVQALYLFLRLDGPPGSGSSDHRRKLIQRLVSLRDAHTLQTEDSVGLVLATIRTDDLTWILDYCRDTTGSTPFIYSTENTPEEGLLIPPTRRGREAPAYLSYIIDFYDHLPKYSVFIHAFPEQWHNDLFGPFTANTLRNLRFESVSAHGYVNLRCQHNPGCPTSVFPLSPSQADIEAHDIRAYFSDAYQQIFNVSADAVPAEIGNVCCGQFAVSRERIHARPKEDYERILNWATTTELTNDFGVGWVLEKLWHIIFGMDAVYCPRFEQCRCDVYGWCGPLPSGEVLQAVTNNDG